jgi:hypothetical protein
MRGRLDADSAFGHVPWKGDNALGRVGQPRSMEATLSRAAIEKLPIPHQVFTKEIPSIHDENATER